MIYDSSKDYLTGRVLLIFDGSEPSREEIDEYCQRNYGFTPHTVDINQPDTGYGGHPNPGRVRCYPQQGEPQ